MIRPLEDKDFNAIKEIYVASDLPPNCNPDLSNPLYLVKAVVERDGKPIMASFLKGTCEVYLLVDHTFGTPQERWLWLQELKNYMVTRAFELGLDEMTCWLPRDVEKSFKKRILELGFVESPWQSYSLPIS